MIIRIAEPDDRFYLVQSILALVQYIKDLGRDIYFDNMREDLEELVASDVETALAQEDRYAAIAEINGDRVGCIYGNIIPPSLPVADIDRIGQIIAIWVEPKHRGSGVGRALTREIEKWFVRQGVAVVELSYYASNLSAEAAWKSLGYEAFRITARKKLDRYSTTH